MPPYPSPPPPLFCKNSLLYRKHVAYLDLLISGSDEPFSFPKENCDLKRLLVVVVVVVVVVNADLGETTACWVALPPATEMPNDSPVCLTMWTTRSTVGLKESSGNSSVNSVDVEADMDAADGDATEEADATACADAALEALAED